MTITRDVCVDTAVLPSLRRRHEAVGPRITAFEWLPPVITTAYPSALPLVGGARA